jgi:DNA-binding GntR family transcriptional regulator
MAKDREAENKILSAHVYESLRREILSGTIPPATRLVRRDLGKRLGVSTIPVTEALLRLERDGLVESRPRSGTRVRPLSLEAVRNDQVLREALECQAARLCAENVNEDQVRELYDLADALDGLLAAADPWSEEGMNRHLEYHLALARAGGYSILVEELQRVWLRRFVQLNWINAIIYPVPPHWHRQLTDAVATRDPAYAEAKMRHHVRYNIEHYLDAARKMDEDARAGTGRRERRMSG